MDRGLQTCLNPRLRLLVSLAEHGEMGEHPLHDQVRNLRIALSDLKIQVSELAAAFERECQPS